MSIARVGKFYVNVSLEI